MEDEGLTRIIIGCAMSVHGALGPGFLESVYQNALAHELSKAGLEVQRRIQVRYDGAVVGDFFADMMIQNSARSVVGVSRISPRPASPDLAAAARPERAVAERTDRRGTVAVPVSMERQGHARPEYGRPGPGDGALQKEALTCRTPACPGVIGVGIHNDEVR
jgi:hypothetical protein